MPRRQPARVVARSTPKPVATPAPARRGFFERLFGRKRATPTPATPTPKPVKKIRRAAPPKTDATKPETRAAEETPSKPEKPAAIRKDAPPPPAPSTPAPTKKARGKAAQPAVANGPVPPTSDDPDVQEKYKYDLAKTKAQADPEVQELKRKSEDAATEDEARKAQRAYNRALFSRMRKIEPGLKDRIDRVEGALMKKLGE